MLNALYLIVVFAGAATITRSIMRFVEYLEG